ncbi:hypothetical protein LLEC1_01246 [Akanthomyces lecanii]|uniref:Uncharacterized protein n=1 Tax=Cordyceps confragosa TaxID=2714763 RepID=A0A179I8Z8_CORDF|nr:hypothetical protein LLEC1_01246 [Akanthomyces lecanii]
MSSTTKYQPAPQDEPDDYTTAPPAYGSSSTANNAAGSAATAGLEAQGLFAHARSSEDNLPDDFKFGGSVAEATVDIRNQFVRKVYTILTVQLLMTAGVSSLSFFSTSYKSWIQAHPGVVWISLIGSMIFLGLTYWKRKSYPTNLLFLSLFTLAEAYTISVIVSFYRTSIVLNAVVLTGGIFIALTLFACQTKYDFTSWMPYLFGALWGLLLFGFMSMFFPYGSTGELLYGGAAALIFSAYVLVDTQMVLRKHHVEEEIAAAISLYLDIINLFLAILRILNSQSNN